jgi:hypothetical protein
VAKLKVFTWSDGFHAYTVAATSRAKALAAWGVTRDLFKDGDAAELTTGPDHDTALAQPGVIVRRGLKVDVGKVKTAPKVRAPKKADVDRVATLEREVTALTAEHAAASGKLLEERKRLDAAEAALDRDHDERLRRLRSRLAAARRKLDG